MRTGDRALADVWHNRGDHPADGDCHGLPRDPARTSPLRIAATSIESLVAASPRLLAVQISESEAVIVAALLSLSLAIFERVIGCVGSGTSVRSPRFHERSRA
jgi:hypothetical protein